MVGNRDNANFKDSNVAQISAYLYYQAAVLSKLESNKAFQDKFKRTIFNQIDKDFGLYIDAKSRISPKSLHHVYEWKKTGNEKFRLFKLNQIDSKGLSFKIDYEFIPSKSYVPTKKERKKYVFANKASVMEAGMPLTISPSSSKRLVFEIDGRVVFMPKGVSVKVQSPGGRASTNQFKLAYSIFFSKNLVSESIKKSGFHSMFKHDISQALSIPSDIKKVKYSFSANAIKAQADAALSKAYGGSLWQ